MSGAVPPLFNTPSRKVQEHVYVVRDNMFHCLDRAIKQTDQPESLFRRCKFAVE